MDVPSSFPFLGHRERFFYSLDRQPVVVSSLKAVAKRASGAWHARVKQQPRPSRHDAQAQTQTHLQLVRQTAADEPNLKKGSAVSS